VTHQSFSIAFAGIPEIRDASFIDTKREASLKFFNQPIILPGI
jgi:hypothetical protein